jgi:DNA-binding transcriptional regulator YiaG
VQRRWRIELSAEVADWYRTLDPADRRVADEMLERLSVFGHRLRMPHSRSLGQGLFELLFATRGAAVEQQISHAFASDRAAITMLSVRQRPSDSPPRCPQRPGWDRPYPENEALAVHGRVDWERLKGEVGASYTPEQQRDYVAAGVETEAQIALTELIYTMRMRAGLSQMELARRMGAAETYVSALERGFRMPTVAALHRVAHATGNRLRIEAVPA